MQIPLRTRIPEKLYFKIGEVTEITGLAAYVLRFWESEFPVIAPKRTASGQRLYRPVDVEAILKVKFLLYDKKFTIEGARNFLKKSSQKTPLSAADTLFQEIRAELHEIKTLLE
jgi:DNA-binding transcriptional MerR regulator